jgi:hypothetical protein
MRGEPNAHASGGSEREWTELDEQDELIEEAARESFPASDPPSWTATHAGTPVPPLLAAPRPESDDPLHHLRWDIHLFGGAIDGGAIDPRDAALSSTTGTLRGAAEHIARRFHDARHALTRYPVAGTFGGENLEVEIRGATRPAEAVVVGAGYDALRGARPTWRNAMGVAALLGVARATAGKRFPRSVRLVAFAGAPSAETPRLGSLHYADMLHAQGVRVVGMVSLDSVGTARQSVPWPIRLLSPRRSDFLALVATRPARAIVREAAAAFAAAVPSVRVRPITLPRILPLRTLGHWAFERRGIPAFVIANGRPRRRDDDDAVDARELERLAELLPGIAAMVATLAS